MARKKVSEQQPTSVDMVPIARLVNEAIDYLNNSKDHREEIKYNAKGAVNNKIEFAIYRTFNINYHNMFIKPKNDCLYGDIVHKLFPQVAYEIKVCTGRHKPNSSYVEYLWSNSTKQSHNKNFVFIKCTIVDDKIRLDAIYFGKDMNYSEFKRKCSKGMEISEAQVCRICQRIW